MRIEVLVGLLLLVGACSSTDTPEGLCQLNVGGRNWDCGLCRFSDDSSMLCCPEFDNTYEPARDRTPEKVWPDGTETVQRRIVWAFPVSGGDHSLKDGHIQGWVLQPTPKSLRPEDWGCPNWTPGT